MEFPSELPGTYVQTRLSLHQLAEHVIAAARYEREGRIGLRATPNGFGTPENTDWQLRVDGIELVVSDKGNERRETITTLGAAAKFVDTKLGAPANVYHPTTACEPDANLNIDPASAKFLSQWIEFSNTQLDFFRTKLKDSESSEIQMWPEHFDLAFESGDEKSGKRAGYGASPGDESYDEPYFYAVPWAAQKPSALWNAHGFTGHVVTWQELSASDSPAQLVEDRLSAARIQIQLAK